MKVPFQYGSESFEIELPDGSEIFASSYPRPSESAADLVDAACRGPIGTPSLADLLKQRRPGAVVVVVSDATRPIPYRSFLPSLLHSIESAGVLPEEIMILIATGMHRPSTAAERLSMFGEQVVDHYRIEDHRAEDASSHVQLDSPSASGASVRLNAHYVRAGFRLVTGLVEPHFMAGFSGGRKAVCPGLADLQTVRNFHGVKSLEHPAACNSVLNQNPLHDEALSVARLCPPDFTLNVVVNRERSLAGAFAGDLEAAHQAACSFVRECCCRPVQRAADCVVTSSGGHPLDATFYQCVKGFVSCLPAVRQGGKVVAFGSCSEGVGSGAYRDLMFRYAGKWGDFLQDAREPGIFIKDQWQFQMHLRALERVGLEGLHFVTDGLSDEVLRRLSVNSHSAQGARVQRIVQNLVDQVVKERGSVAAFPEGPYCVPTATHN